MPCCTNSFFAEISFVGSLADLESNVAVGLNFLVNDEQFM